MALSFLTNTLQALFGNRRFLRHRGMYNFLIFLGRPGWLAALVTMAFLQ